MNKKIKKEYSVFSEEQLKMLENIKKEIIKQEDKPTKKL